MLHRVIQTKLLQEPVLAQCGGDGGDGPAKLKNRLEPSDDCPANGENCKDDNDDEDNNMKI